MAATKSAYRNICDYYKTALFPRRWADSSFMSFFLFVLMLLPYKTSFAGDKLNKQLSNRALVDLFYQRRAGQAFWFSPRPESMELRSQLVSLIEGCEQRGLDKYRYAYEPLKACQAEYGLPPDEKIVYERLYTDVAISFLRDIQAGVGMEAMVSYDEFSLKYKQNDNTRLLELLDTIQSGPSLLRAVETLEPSTEAYRALAGALKKAIERCDLDNSSKLKTALNCYRWINHFGFEKYIIVNVPSATLHYVEAGSIVINMKIVAGMPATPTPRFAAHCDEVILYPYWNVPRSIAVKEILPAVKKVAGVLEFLNMQVIDKKGNIIDPATVHWTAYNSRNFPYHFRQSTGCDNALGVIKFNLTSPFSVYLHDTNMKPAFSATKRYFSHGCIRVEKPLELANYLLTEKPDDAFLAACLKNQRPVHIALAQPVPVFVIYVMAEAEAGQVVFYDDVYKVQ
jgi:L,D-transpeptidase YcbB